jgi:hypothetical protein
MLRAPKLETIRLVELVMGRLSHTTPAMATTHQRTTSRTSGSADDSMLLPSEHSRLAAMAPFERNCALDRDGEPRIATNGNRPCESAHAALAAVARCR